MFVRVVRMWFTRISILFKRRTVKCHRWFINLIKTRRTNKRNYGFRKQSQKKHRFSNDTRALEKYYRAEGALSSSGRIPIVDFCSVRIRLRLYPAPFVTR